MPIAPAKVERVTTDNRQIVDLEFVGNPFRFQRPLTGPFIDALGARAHASQRRGVVVANSIIGPGDPQLRIALLRNLAGFNCLPSLGDINHNRSLLIDLNQRRPHGVSAYLSVRSCPQDFLIAHDENLRSLMGDSGPRLDFIGHCARLLHYHQANRMLEPGHFGVRPRANAAEVAMFEDNDERTV